MDFSKYPTSKVDGLNMSVNRYGFFESFVVAQ